MILLSVVLALVGAGLIIVLQKGFNEVIKGMESLDKRLERIEKSLSERDD